MAFFSCGAFGRSLQAAPLTAIDGPAPPFVSWGLRSRPGKPPASPRRITPKLSAWMPKKCDVACVSRARSLPQAKCEIAPRSGTFGYPINLVSVLPKIIQLATGQRIGGTFPSKEP